MSRITPLDPSAAAEPARTLLAGVQATLGVTPNMMKTMAASPAVLKGYLGLNDALGTGVLEHAFREQIALTVGQTNACGYCLAAHHVLGAMAGLTAEEMARSRDARSRNPRREAGLQFAHAVVVDRGQVSDAALAKVRAAGFDDAEIVEIVANVALNIFTNYVNHVAQTTIDFPRVDLASAASA